MLDDSDTSFLHEAVLPNHLTDGMQPSDQRLLPDHFNEQSNNQYYDERRCRFSTIYVNSYDGNKRGTERWNNPLVADENGIARMVLKQQTQHTLVIPHMDDMWNATLTCSLNAVNEDWQASKRPVNHDGTPDVTTMKFCVYVGACNMNDEPVHKGTLFCGENISIDLRLPAGSNKICIVTSPNRPESTEGDRKPNAQWRPINLTFKLTMTSYDNYYIECKRSYVLVSKAKVEKKAAEISSVPESVDVFQTGDITKGDISETANIADFVSHSNVPTNRSSKHKRKARRELKMEDEKRSRTSTQCFELFC